MNGQKQRPARHSTRDRVKRPRKHVATIGSVITTYNRPRMLERTLPSIAGLGSAVLIVDDGSDAGIAGQNRGICEHVRSTVHNDVLYLYIPRNRGLVCSLTVGLTYWLVEHGIDYISYFQDDTEADPLTHDVLVDAHRALGGGRMVLTGHDAREHKIVKRTKVDGIGAAMKEACRGTHLFATRKAWESVLPIPSVGVGYPKRIRPDYGEGSNEDWWITRDAPNPLPVWCVPGLVRSFAWRACDSCWHNQQIAGEDMELSRAAIKGWLAKRMA